jgi:hypothetical protein
MHTGSSEKRLEMNQSGNHPLIMKIGETTSTRLMKDGGSTTIGLLSSLMFGQMKIK